MMTHFTSTPRLLLLLGVLLLVSAVVADEPTTAPETPPAPTAETTPETRPQVSYEALILTADRILFRLDHKDVLAEGAVDVLSPEGNFRAERVFYNTDTRAGRLDGAQGTIDIFYMKAQQLGLEPGKAMLVHDATLTTCNKEHPHYLLRVKDASISPEHEMDARKVSLEYMGHRLFTIPRLHQGLMQGEDKQSLMPTLSFGSSGIDGAYAAGNFDYPLDDQTAISLQARAGTAGLIRGGLFVERAFTVSDWGKGTVSLIATNREDVSNRLLDTDEDVDARLEDLTISRLPALQVAFDPVPLSGSLRGASLAFGGGYGRYREDTTHVSNDRAQLWGIFSSPHFNLGLLRLSGQYGLRQAFYRETQHITYAAQVTLDTPMDGERYFNLSYLQRRSTGETPFLFDRVLVPREVYSEFDVPVTKNKRWYLDVWSRYDLDHRALRDVNVTAYFKQDCISYGLAYNHASHSIGLGVVINAFGSFRHGVSGIGFTQ